MNLTLKNFWNAAINPDDEYAPYAPQTVSVRGIKDDTQFIRFDDEKNDPNNADGDVQSNLILNYYNFLDQNKANCNTGIKVDLRNTSFLCGKTKVEIRFVGVTEIDNTNSIQMTQLITEINKKSQMWAEFMYDGFDRYIEIQGGCFIPFIGTRVDMEITLTNCVGDKHSYRNFVEITRESI